MTDKLVKGIVLKKRNKTPGKRYIIKLPDEINLRLDWMIK
jgi:hypothetical protein